MLQFVEEIGSRIGFVDLHNHTDLSFGDEHNRMNISPTDLLNSALLYSQNNSNAPVTFSITDHNNIDSIKEVREVISKEPEKYKNIRFINGCEFSCSGAGFGTMIDEKGVKHRVIRKLHVLAYNFDENDAKINFVTKLYDDTLPYLYSRGGVKVSTGRYVLAVRNMLFENGKFLPLESFYEFDLTKNQRSEIEFVDDLMKFCETKFNLDKKECEEISDRLMSDEIFKFFKIDALEVAEIVEGAGGCVVLAHPSLITYGHSFEVQNPNIKHMYKYLKQVNFVVKNFTDFTSPYTGKHVNGLTGIEILHKSTFRKYGDFENLIKIAKENNLYITGGSDSHGTLLNETFSEICPKNFSMNNKYNFIVMYQNLFAEKVLSGKISTQKKCTLPFEQQIKVVETLKDHERFLTVADILEKKSIVGTLNTAKKSKKPNKINNEESKKQNEKKTGRLKGSKKRKYKKSSESFRTKKKFKRKKQKSYSSGKDYDKFVKINKNKSKNDDREF